VSASRFATADGHTRAKPVGRSPGFLLWQATNLWQRAVRDALAPLGLTHVQFVLLAALVLLGEGERPRTQRALAAHARTDEMMTSQALRALEGKDLVRREVDPGDRRARRVEPTAAGTRLARDAVGVVEAADEAFFAALGTSERGFLTGLRKLAG